MHTTVLLHETIDGLALKDGDILVDGTLGRGGHSLEACKRMGASIRQIGIDRDEDAIARAKQRLADADCNGTFVLGNAANIGAILDDLGLATFDKFVLDLGISSDQLDASGRGFTFKTDEPLAMTMLAHPGVDDLTARTIVNEWEESSIADIIYGYGEERYSRKIAKAIIEARSIAPIETTGQLVDIIASAVPASYRRGKPHFATRTFQALRIATNDELGSLERALADGFARLAPGGRMAIISFHSLEDRIVKRFNKARVDADEAVAITKKPIVPTEEEIMANPRSRSAKLRIIQKK